MSAIWEETKPGASVPDGTTSNDETQDKGADMPETARQVHTPPGRLYVVCSGHSPMPLHRQISSRRRRVGWKLRLSALNERLVNLLLLIRLI